MESAHESKPSSTRSETNSGASLNGGASLNSGADVNDSNSAAGPASQPTENVRQPSAGAENESNPLSSPPSSAENSPEAETASLGPMEGGRWRPVRPDELLRKNVPPTVTEADKPAAPRVPLQRRQELEQKLKLCPTDLEAYLELARIYRSEERPIDAKRILQQGLQTFPNDERLIWELEEATLARSRQQLREVSELASRLNTPEANRELQRSQTDWACRRMDVCRARLLRDPNQKQLHLVLAEAMFDSGMFEGALEQIQHVYAIDELSAQAHLLAGRTLLAMGKDLDSMPMFRAVALRRAVPAPLKMRVIALRFLCEIAERLGTTMTLARYRSQLAACEQELAKLVPTS